MGLVGLGLLEDGTWVVDGHLFDGVVGDASVTEELGEFEGDEGVAPVWDAFGLYFLGEAVHAAGVVGEGDAVGVAALDEGGDHVGALLAGAGVGETDAVHAAVGA